MFISTSPILLALLALLVSATPIPSLDVVSKGDTNALIMRSPPDSSQPQPPSVAQPDKLLEHMTHPEYYYQLPEKVLLEDIHEYEKLIASVTEADVKNTGPEIFIAIGHLKLFVARSPKHQQGAIHGIKACEDKAVDKGLPRWVPSFKPPKKLDGFFEGNERKFTKHDTHEQVTDLHTLVGQVLSLTLTEYESIREQLRKEYNAIEVMIDGWKEGENENQAKMMMRDWKAMGTLVDTFSKLSAKV
ncbi:hypothetical protein H0H93_005246 [Arthromyces matolae]|nr:hypothetical protein H0H93_005246 [Arthromyces matolae]